MGKKGGGYEFLLLSSRPRAQESLRDEQDGFGQWDWPERGGLRGYTLRMWRAIRSAWTRYSEGRVFSRWASHCFTTQKLAAMAAKERWRFWRTKAGMLGGINCFLHTCEARLSLWRATSSVCHNGHNTVSASSCFLISRYVLGNTFDADGKELHCMMTWSGRGACMHAYVADIA